MGSGICEIYFLLASRLYDADAISPFAIPIDMGIVGIRKETEFTHTDGYVISSPLVRLYVTGCELRTESFNTFSRKTVSLLFILIIRETIIFAQRN
jgi:hypothetical protein